MPFARRQRWRFTHQRQIQIFCFLCGSPGFFAAVILLWAGHFPLKVHLTVISLTLLFWLIFSISLYNRMIRPLQSASNMLSALREGDFSLQAGYIHDEDPLGQVMLEINRLTQTLSQQRMGALAAAKLLEKVVGEIDAAVFTFDPEGKVRTVNPAGARLLGRPAGEIIGRTAAHLGLEACLDCPADSTFTAGASFARPGRYAIREGVFREDGKPHRLLIVTDVSLTLREEERTAWKRLIRVLGHELNNSLAPIHSLSASLRQLVAQPVPPDDWREDMQEGLTVIQDRAESLTRFMREYSRLARLPPPSPGKVRLTELLEHCRNLFANPAPQLREGPEVAVWADPVQLEQVLINLLKNACEASGPESAPVVISWQQEGPTVVLVIEDNGPGVANPENLFIPFFSTKPGGSGIGLTLSRQIIESHDGQLLLENRPPPTTGARAIVRLPAAP